MSLHWNLIDYMYSIPGNLEMIDSIYDKATIS
jgi:hypothetical protein